MLASPAIPAQRGIVALPRSVVAPRGDAAAEDRPRVHVTPRAPWSGNHRTFRGTRILTSFVLAWTGAILVAFGAMVVPAAHDAGRGSVDAGLMSLLGTVAPWLAGLGIVSLVAAYGAARDRGWWTGLATWVLAAAALAIVAGAVLAVSGRDPFAVTAVGGSSPAGQGLGILAWTLGLFGVAGWGVRRVARARELVV